MYRKLNSFRPLANMHKYLLSRNAGSNDIEQLLLDLDVDYSADSARAASLIPENPSIRALSIGLAFAHFLFGDTRAVILFVVQPGDACIFDK